MMSIPSVPTMESIRNLMPYPPWRSSAAAESASVPVAEDDWVAETSSSAPKQVAPKAAVPTPAAPVEDEGDAELSFSVPKSAAHELASPAVSLLLLQ